MANAKTAPVDISADVKAIIKAGGSDADVTKYLDKSGAKYSIDKDPYGLESLPGKSSPDMTTSQGPLGDLVSGVARGIVGGGQQMISTGVNAYELLSKLTGQQPSEAPRQFLQESQQGLNELIPPTGTFAQSIGTGLGEIPGIVTTYANPVTKAIGVLPVAAGIGAINAQQGGAGAMVGGAAENTAIMALLGKAQGMKVVPGALTGAATMGGATALHGGTPQEIAAQAVLGAGFAMAKPETPAEISKFVDNVNRVVSNPKESAKILHHALTTDPVDSILHDISKREKNVKDSISGLPVREKDQISRIEESYKNKKSINEQIYDASLSKIELEKQKEDISIMRDINDKSDYINSQIDSYNSKVESTSMESARNVQKELPAFEKHMSGVYGKIYDRLAKRIDKNAPISNDDAVKILTEAAKKVTNDTADEADPVLKHITKLLDTKYSSDSILGIDADGRKVTVGMVDEMKPGSSQLQMLAELRPDIMQKYTDFNNGKGVSFKEFHSDLKRIWNSQDLGSHSADVLRHTFGDYIAVKIPAFQKLQDSYRPILDYRGRINKIFQPYGSEANLEQGYGFMKQFATGKESPVDSKILSFLESGLVEGKATRFTSGMGDVSGKLKDIGLKLDKLQKQNAFLKDEETAKITAIAQESINRIQSLESTKKLTEQAFEDERALGVSKIKDESMRQRMEFEIKLNRLKGHENQIKQIRKRRDAQEMVANSISQMLGGLGGYKISRLGRGVVMLKRALRKF